ncbi:YybH family protein [Chelativorans salis]|uniref:Nuclear transport factor 2 family protein n=1 Tax=Chelativorans salis TaxID=2978478 RepID=A0ABT2LGY2_9HYPH|nr:nuclear transport factor 2 family protein [Chelativorans sp. EGI FJ00035]MCT7373790.1 nuclear transport factor 2 family protein [Chelativorans sp. EGI FJ00035]
MFTATKPEDMNPTFARAFNSRDIENLMALYEQRAQLRADETGRTHTGHAAIRAELTALLQAPGTMTSRNNFCLVFEDIALLRADWMLEHGGQTIASGSSAEIVRRQDDGRWLYIVDHAMGASLPAIT